MPSTWDGRDAILAMREANDPHWRQMEWIGFYFQWLCGKMLTPAVQIPGSTYGRVEFDGFAEIPWDFKVHPEHDAKGKPNTAVILNDRRATMSAIESYGSVGLILAHGDATYNDEDRSFQRWHKKLKGGASAYEKERIARKAPSRLRKTAFLLKKIDLLILDRTIVDQANSFQTGFRNSDGSPRKAKVLLRLSAVQPIASISF